MHLMFGDYIKSVSIIQNHRRYGRVVLADHSLVTEEQAVLCLLAGPVAEVFCKHRDRMSEACSAEMYDMAHAEGVFDVVEGRRKVTTRRYFKHLCLCVEIMGQPDFREAVKLLAARLMKHRYLSHERVIRLKDWPSLGNIRHEPWSHFPCQENTDQNNFKDGTEGSCVGDGGMNARAI
jgi:hypothetical protein